MATKPRKRPRVNVRKKAAINSPPERREMAQSDPARPNSAAFRLRAGKVKIGAEVSVTPQGLLAIGGLVSSILLSTAVVIWAASGRPRRRRF